MNGISIPEKKKKLNTEFSVVSTHAVEIVDHLNENWSDRLLKKNLTQ